MQRIAHLSDLHFGRDRPELVRPLIEAVNRLEPDLVAVSGDLTQRARSSQFRAARAFLDRLDPPWLSVPGNHDISLGNLWSRWVHPWRRYRRHVARDLEPRHVAGDVAVVGVNTVNPFDWRRGRVGRRGLRRAEAAFRATDAGCRVVVLHHPLEHGPGVRQGLTRGAGRALQQWSESGADILLSGHLHSWRAAPVRKAAGLLLVQAGTGLSTRVRGEPNGFNLLTVDWPEVAVARYEAGAGGFVEAGIERFEKSSGRWRAVGAEAASKRLDAVSKPRGPCL